MTDLGEILKNPSLRTPSLISVGLHGIAILLIWLGIHRLELISPFHRERPGLALDWSRTERAERSAPPTQPSRPKVTQTETTPTQTNPELALATQAPSGGATQSAGGAPSGSQHGVNLEFSRQLMAIRSKIERAMVYPISLRRRGVSGSVSLALVIDASGALKSVEIAESSGTPELDQLALDAAKRASPFASSALGPELKLRLPVLFKIL